MLYVKINDEQAKKLGAKKVGLTSGKKDKKTGKRPLIKFCSNLDFIRQFGCDIEKEFITI